VAGCRLDVIAQTVEELQAVAASTTDASGHFPALYDDAGRAACVRELDRLVSVLGYLITRPVFPASVFVRLARRLEERDPEKTTHVLLGQRPPRAKT
jgi:hypothetical protein